MKARVWVTTLLITAFAFALVACGDDNEEKDKTSAGEAKTEKGAAAGGKVSVVDFAFEPKDLKIKSGDTVTWKNTGDTTHTVKGPGVFSEAIDPGDSFSHRFTRKGTFTFAYICTLHPQDMKGEIVVTS